MENFKVKKEKSVSQQPQKNKEPLARKVYMLPPKNKLSFQWRDHHTSTALEKRENLTF